VSAEASPASSWPDAILAAALLAVDPAGLGGAALRSGPGPARDRWLHALREALAPGAPIAKIPAHIGDERLLGGLDLALTLSAGRPIAQRGLLSDCDGGVAILAMAERVDAGRAARLTAVLDQGEVVVERDGLALRLPARLGLVALDESLGAEEQVCAALMDRLALHIDLTGVTRHDLLIAGPDPDAVSTARATLAGVATATEAILEGLCARAANLGVASPRAPILALKVARAHAALKGRSEITAEDAGVAARLVLAPRATQVPADPESQTDDAPEPVDPPPPSDSADPPPPPVDPQDLDPAEADLVIAAIQAALPEDLLARVMIRHGARASSGRGGGGVAKPAARGRPIGSRQGDLKSGDRLNLVETLRAAAPWQRLRAQGEAGRRVRVRAQDFRIRRFVRDPETTTIFVVDASGSSAMNRLSEAKGAVELLLAKAYVSRARVALIAFRGQGAEVLLPATRSLTRAKRRLADLPGGGGTPLAAGIEAARLLAQGEKAQQRAPMVVFLTDGRANIGRDGGPGRAAAAADALAAAGRFGEAGFDAVFIDTSPRPQPDGDHLARAMGAVYAPLPYLQAQAVVDVLNVAAPLRGRS
jgi:magnesium chelatase subunit D